MNDRRAPASATTASADDPAHQELGRRLRHKRRWAGYSDRAAAQALGCSQGRVQKWENGTNRISAVDLARVCKLYDADPAQMLRNLEANNGR